MNIEYDNFILARAGYNKKLGKQVTWDELKKSFLLYKRIPMIVAGGDHYGPIDPNKAIGFVDAKFDDERQVVRGEPVFYQERFDTIPAAIQNKLAHKERVHASLGYEPYDSIRKIDHIAIGVDSPVFPDIGFNAESTFVYEETDGMNNPPDEHEQQEDPKQAQFVTLEQFEQFKTELFERLQPSTPQEATAEVDTVETTEEPTTEQQTEEPPKEPLTVSQPKPKVEPERVIPKAQPQTNTTGDGLFVLKEGTRVISSQIGRPLDKQTENK